MARRTPAAGRFLVRVAGAAGVAALAWMFVASVHPIAEQSMWPTLWGGRDRVLVDRLAARLREPRRFDLWVFRSDDPARGGLFVKRVLGLSGEVVDFRGGDLFIGGADGDVVRVARSEALMRAQTLRVPGAACPDGTPPWESKGGVVAADGQGGLRLAPEPGRRLVATFVAGVGADPHCVKDDHFAGDGRLVRGRHAVPDVGIAFDEILGEFSRIVIVHELGHGEAVRVVLDPDGIVIEASVDGAVSTLSKHPGADARGGLAMETRDGAFRVRRRESAAWRDLFEGPRDTIAPEGGSTVRIEAEGGPVTFAALAITRDVHYVWSADFPPSPLLVPEGRLFFAGDNPEVSVDSRSFGPVPKRALVGLVRCVVWPLPMRIPE